MVSKQFNTAGPCKPDKHYMIDPLTRIDHQELLNLIADERYFVLHAPRQTGKTTLLRALIDQLNASGEYRAVYANIEGRRQRGMMWLPAWPPSPRFWPGKSA